MNWIVERNAIRDEARQLLDRLGEDADGVAAALATERVRGKPHSLRGCAVALYVGAIVAADPRVHSVSVWTTPACTSGQRQGRAGAGRSGCDFRQPCATSSWRSTLADSPARRRRPRPDRLKD
jgi:hypothetical protein